MANVESMEAEAEVYGYGVGGREVVLRNRLSQETVRLNYASAGGSIGAGVSAPVNFGVNVDSLHLPSGSFGSVYAGAKSLWNLNRQDFGGFWICSLSARMGR